MNLDLLALPRGTQLRIGNQAVIEVTRLRNPCVQINACQPRLLNVVLGRDDNGELVRKAAIMGVVVQGGPRTAGLGLAGIVQPKADLQTDLKLSNGAIRHLAADLRDLEPFQVSQRLACARYAVADGLLETLRRTTHYFGDAICVIGHGRPPDFAENTWIDNHTRVRCRAQPLPAVATEHPRRSAINSLTSPNPLQPSAEPWQFTGSAIEWRFLADSYARLGPARVRRARPYFWHAVSSPAVCNGRWSSTDSIDGLSAELDLHEWLFVPSSLALTMHR